MGIVSLFGLVLALAVPVPPGQDEPTLARVEELAVEVVEARQRGRFEDALEIALRRRALLQEIPGARPWLLAEAAEEIALLGEVVAAEPAWRERFLAAEQLYSDTLEAHLARDLDPALAGARELLAERLALAGPDSRETLWARIELGGVLRDRGELQQAYPEAQHAVEEAVRVLGPDDPLVAYARDELGRLLEAGGERERAEEHYREAHRIYSAEGGIALRRISNLNNLGNLCLRQDRYGEAETYLLASLELLRLLRGPESRSFAVALNGLAVFYTQRGELGRAEVLQRRSLALLRSVTDPRHPDVAAVCRNLGALLRRKGSFAEAEHFYREALDIFLDAFGDGHPQVALTYNNLAVTLSALGRDAEAEELAREALEIQRERLGSGHPHVATTVSNLATAVQQQDRWEEAEELRREALAIRLERLGRDHLDTARALHNLGVVLFQRRLLDEAESLAREALEIRRRLLGRAAPDCIASLRQVADCRLAQGDRETARGLLEEAAAAFEEARLRVGPGVARATFGESPYPALAAVLLYEGLGDEAWTTLERGRARALHDLVLDAEREALTPAESRREAELRARVNRLEGEVAGLRRAAEGDPGGAAAGAVEEARTCLLYTSPSPRDRTRSRMPSSA